VASDSALSALGACEIDSSDANCLPRISELLYSVLARFSLPYLIEHQRVFTGLSSRAEILAYRTELHELFTAATDRLSRLSALVLLHAAAEVEPTSAKRPPQPSFAPKVFATLSTLTAAEAELLLEPRVSAPPDDASAEALVVLATSAQTDPRVRVAALGALASSRYGARLGDVIAACDLDAAQSAPLLSSRALPTALADCGRECFDTLASLLQSGGAAQRWVARTALRITSEADRAALAQVTSLPDGLLEAIDTSPELDLSHYALTMSQEDGR
jgi:hypothetical protein